MDKKLQLIIFSFIGILVLVVGVLFVNFSNVSKNCAISESGNIEEYVNKITNDSALSQLNLSREKILKLRMTECLSESGFFVKNFNAIEGFMIGFIIQFLILFLFLGPLKSMEDNNWKILVAFILALALSGLCLLQNLGILGVIIGGVLSLIVIKVILDYSFISAILFSIGLGIVNHFVVVWALNILTMFAK